MIFTAKFIIFGYYLLIYYQTHNPRPVGYFRSDRHIQSDFENISLILKNPVNYDWLKGQEWVGLVRLCQRIYRTNQLVSIPDRASHLKRIKTSKTWLNANYQPKSHQLFRSYKMNLNVASGIKQSQVHGFL